MLRCFQCGIRLDELNHMDYGMVQDILIESANDNYQYKQKATQKDFDNFL